VRGSLRGPTEDDEVDEGHADAEELPSLLELEWVEDLELSPWTRFAVQTYVDPVQKNIRRHKYEIAGVSLMTYILYKVTDAMGSSASRNVGGDYQQVEIA
jgi:hypothetical protein